MKIVVGCLAIACSGQELFLSRQTVSANDLSRAKRQSQTGNLGGNGPQEIAQKLNKQLQSMAPVRECTDHSIAELNVLLQDMFKLASPELQAVYRQNSDLRMKRAETSMELEAAMLSEMETDLETLQHSRCAEIAMMFAHHLSESDKKSFTKTLPSVPVFNSTKANDALYAQSLSCQTGHSMKKGGDGTSSHEWPDWPEELHYKAKGHGAYPFWWGGGSDSGTADLEVWWSEKQGYELFYHSSCSGLDSWQQGACYHLMLAPTSEGAAPLSYLFDSDAHEGNGGNCCLTNPTAGGGGSGQTLTLNPAQGTFWNTFTDMGEVDFNGVYYTGKARYYLLTNVPGAVADFWYFTDLEGKPVQQGEAGTGPTDQGYPTSFGHTIWHDYDPATFDTSAQDSSIARVPAVCKTTTSSCAFP